MSWGVPLRDPTVVALATLRAHKLRSFLMLLGIILSVATLIVVIALIEGTNRYIADRVANMGSNVFLVSRFIDHIDGELARQTGKSARFGHYFDAVTGTISYAALFLGIGVGLWRDGAGEWTIVLPIVVALAIALNTALQLRWEAVLENPPPTYPRIGPFALEDGIHLIGPIVWLGGLFPFFVAACLCTLLYFTVRVSLHVLRD